MTPAEAVAALTRSDRRRLLAYAARRDRRDPEDLLQDAIMLTLEGRRVWRPEKVDLFGHLMGAMRSLSSHARAAARPTEELDGREPAADARTVEALEAREQLAALRPRLSERDLRVVSLMEEGLSGPEIKAALGFCQRDLETAMKNLRRKARKREEDDMGGKAEDLFRAVLAEAEKANAALETPMPTIATLLQRTGNTYGFGPASVWAKRNEPDLYARLYATLGRAAPERKPKREPDPAATTVEPGVVLFSPEEETTAPTKADVLATCVNYLEQLEPEDRVTVLASAAVYFRIKGAFFMLDMCGGKESR